MTDLVVGRGDPMRFFRKFGLAAVVGGMLLAASVRADDDGDANAPQAARAVRLSYVEGDVHLFQGNQALTDQALANTPLFEGARIETGSDGRAEIQFEDGSVARVSPQSALTISVLKGLSANGERDAELLLSRGLGYFELQGDSDSNHIKVRFGDTEVNASGFTVLRINADKSPGELAVFSGNAHIEGGASPTLDLHGGESVALNANDPNSYNLAETIEPDSWDAWNSDRDQDLSNAAADRTAATQEQPDNQNPAWSDLDANGNWYNVPDQGYVWSPNEASNPGFDPYDNGYWMNEPGYGYTWISGYPWGYLPYSCGAWNWYSSFGWGWAPGMCNPWWGGYGGWVVNIGIAPPRYRYPVRPRRWNPRPMGGHEGPPLVIPVNRHSPPAGTMPAPRDKTGTVLLAGHPVQPLRPVQQQHRIPYVPYNHAGPVGGSHLAPSMPVTSAPVRPAFDGHSTPRGVTPPERPGGTYVPAPRNTYGPPPTVPAAPTAARTYTPPPTYTPTPAPARPSGGGSFPQPSAPSHSSSPAPSHSGGGGGGGHVSSGGGGGGHSGGGGGVGGGGHASGGGGGGHH